MQIKLLDRYIFKQVFWASFVCIALFIIVWLAPEKLVAIIQLWCAKKISFLVGCKMLLYHTPYVLSKALPVGIFLGCLYVFNRMSKDSELTVIRSCGIEFWRILVMPVILSIFFSVSCFFVYDRLIPVSTKNLFIIKNEFKFGHFVYAVKDENKNLEQLVIIKHYNNRQGMSDIIVLNFNRQNVSKISLLSDIIISKKVEFTDLKWDLYDNTQYVIKANGVFEEVKTPEKICILHGKSATTAKQLMNYGLKKDTELTNNEMKNYISILKSEEIMDLYNLNLNKYLQRIFHSAICILFAILGCLLGYSNPREQKLIGFTIAVGIVFLYYMTIPFFNLMAEKSIMSPFLTSTIQPILLIILIYFYKKHKGL